MKQTKRQISAKAKIKTFIKVALAVFLLFLISRKVVDWYL